MLELIILGEVPGTDVRLTFAQALLGFLIVLFIMNHDRTTQVESGGKEKTTKKTHPAQAK